MRRVCTGGEGEGGKGWEGGNESYQVIYMYVMVLSPAKSLNNSVWNGEEGLCAYLAESSNQ